MGIGALCVGGLVLLREPLISIAFGRSYLPGADLLPLLATAMACMAVVSVLVYFHIAVRSRAYVITVAGAALEIVLITLFHGEEIAAVAQDRLLRGALPVPGSELDLPPPPLGSGW